jgi:hypothetical protein
MSAIKDKLMNDYLTDKPKLSFPCTCNGCRNYPTRPAEIWHESQIATKAQGYYFSRDTMRFFSSRIADFKPVSISPRCDSLMVIVSSKHGDSARDYEIVTLCPYGELAREWAQDSDGVPVNQYESLRAARKSARWNSTIAPQICDCHGCQLDQAGR